MLVVNDDLSIPLAELRFSFSRSGGPGGQNVNKLNSKATLRWSPTASRHLPDDVRQRFLAKYARRITRGGELVLSSQRYRDPGRNVADCLAKLRAMLSEVSVPPKPRKASRRTKASREERLRKKKVLSARKERRRRPSLDE
jgi:ribosome-associated protein